MADETDPLGGFLRMQRELADLSVRQLADMANVSNAYLSQVERGLYHPSAQVRVRARRAATSGVKSESPEAITKVETKPRS